jgi:hypothetical protein
VRALLLEGASCRLIATSRVEAGVDLDFRRVWRAEAGLDQAAGRCNREGRRSPKESIVTVFKPAEYKPPREIAQLSGDFARVAGKHDDLLSLDTIRNYCSGPSEGAQSSPRQRPRTFRRREALRQPRRAQDGRALPRQHWPSLGGGRILQLEDSII